MTIYIYILSSTDCFVVSQLFSVARHIGLLKLGSKPTQFYVRLSIIPLSQQANHIRLGIIRHYVVAFVCLHFWLTGYQSAQFIRRALHDASGSHKFFQQSAQPPVGEHIYYHPQTDCFIVSQFFNVARHVGHLKLGSKSTQLYIRLCKLERIIIKLYRQNAPLLFHQTCLNEGLLPNHTHTHTHTCVCVWLLIIVKTVFIDTK